MDSIERIRQAQVRAGEAACIQSLADQGLATHPYKELFEAVARIKAGKSDVLDATFMDDIQRLAREAGYTP